VKSAAVSTSASSVSSETPVQVVPSFDHFVTQWMSTVTVSAGSASSCAHDHSCRCPASVAISNRQASGGIRGVGPADSTGKSSVRYCPGGSSGPAGRRRPENPGDTIAMCSVNPRGPPRSERRDGSGGPFPPFPLIMESAAPFVGNGVAHSMINLGGGVGAGARGAAASGEMGGMTVSTRAAVPSGGAP